MSKRTFRVWLKMGSQPRKKAIDVKLVYVDANTSKEAKCLGEENNPGYKASTAVAVNR